MLEILKTIPVSILLGASVLAVGLLAVIAFRALREGREVSFWPPRIGPAVLAGGAAEPKASQPAPHADGSVPAKLRQSIESQTAGGDVQAVPSVHLRSALIGVLVIRSGPDVGKNYMLTQAVRSLTLGRAPGNEIRLEDACLSQTHCKFVVRPIDNEKGGARADYDVEVVDCGSANGTFVNGRRVHQAELVDNDLIQVGATEIGYKQIAPSRR